jgi:hypothetical protein
MDPFWKMMIVILVAGFGYFIYQLMELEKEKTKNACKHKWKTINTDNIRRGDRHIGEHHTLQCEKCGDITDRKLTV